ncbi:hypothetical protein RRF57_011005 [Xylaria bambusicola]|uniref:Uncharacterized protein n=1 Tax=Xylaria bambusicola TaxID=326684 RepID=A0AAN7UU06_9PEZI
MLAAKPLADIALALCAPATPGAAQRPRLERWRRAQPYRGSLKRLGDRLPELATAVTGLERQAEEHGEQKYIDRKARDEFSEYFQSLYALTFSQGAIVHSLRHVPMLPL